MNGEQGRIERSPLLGLVSKLHKDREIDSHAAEIRGHQSELDTKISEISSQIVAEEKAVAGGQPIPEREGGTSAIELECPSCGADLPMPTGRFVKCQYCNATISLRDVSPQIKNIIQNI